MTKAELDTIVQTASERPIYGASNNMCEHAEAHTSTSCFQSEYPRGQCYLGVSA